MESKQNDDNFETMKAKMDVYLEKRRQKIRAQHKRDREAEEKQLVINIEKFKAKGKYPDKKDFGPEIWQADKLNFHLEINTAFDFSHIFRLIGQEIDLNEPVTLQDTRYEAIAKLWHQKPRLRFPRVAFEYSSQHESKVHYVFDYQHTDTRIGQFERFISTSKTPWTLADEIASRRSSEIRFTYQEIFIIAAGLIDMCQSWKDMNFYHLFLNPSNIELVEPDAVFWKRFKSWNIDQKSGQVFDVRWIERKPSLWESHSVKSRIDECVDNMIKWKNAHWLKLQDREFDAAVNPKWVDDLTSVGFCLFQMISGEEFAGVGDTKQSGTTQFDKRSEFVEKYHQTIVAMFEKDAIENSPECWTSKLSQLILFLLNNYKAEIYKQPYHKLWWISENCFKTNNHDKEDFGASQDRREERQRKCFDQIAVRRNCVTMITLIGLTEEELKYEFLHDLFSPFAKRDQNGYHYLRLESFKNSGKYAGMISFLGDDQQERAHCAAKTLGGFREGVVMFVEDNVRLDHDMYW